MVTAGRNNFLCSCIKKTNKKQPHGLVINLQSKCLRSGRAETREVVMIFKTAGPSSWPFAPVYKKHQKDQKTFAPKGARCV